MARGKIIDRDIAVAVHKLRAEKKSWNAIESCLNHSWSWAHSVWTKYEASTGLPHQTEKTGWPRGTDSVSDEATGKLAIGLRRTNSKRIRNILANHEITDVSASTIQRRLKESKIRSTRPVKDVLTDVHEANRVKWCSDRKAELQGNAFLFQTWIFSDEARFSLDDCGYGKVGDWLIGWLFDQLIGPRVFQLHLIIILNYISQYLIFFILDLFGKRWKSSRGEYPSAREQPTWFGDGVWSHFTWWSGLFYVSDGKRRSSSRTLGTNPNDNSSSLSGRYAGVRFTFSRSRWEPWLHLRLTTGRCCYTYGNNYEILFLSGRHCISPLGFEEPGSKSYRKRLGLDEDDTRKNGRGNSWGAGKHSLWSLGASVHSCGVSENVPLSSCQTGPGDWSGWFSDCLLIFLLVSRVLIQWFFNGIFL